MISLDKVKSIIEKDSFLFSDGNKIIQFLSILEKKIKDADKSEFDLEKQYFFNLLVSLLIKDDVDIDFKNKQRFMKNFVYDSGAFLRRKVFSFISPVTLSVYVPEFYQTVNEFFPDGEDLNMPVFKKKNIPDLSDENDEKLQKFNVMLDDINKVAESEDDIATQLLVKYLRSGGKELNLDDGSYFATSFRKYDVIANDRICVKFKIKKDSEDVEINSSKDMIVWNFLNHRPYPFIKVLDQRLTPSDLFFEKLESFFNKEEEEEEEEEEEDLCK